MYDFPPIVPMSINVGAFALYVLLIAFALAAILRVFAFHEHRPQKSVIWRLWASLAYAAAIALVGVVHPQSRARLQEYLTYFGILFGSLAVMTLIRQFRERPVSALLVPPAIGLAVLIATIVSPLPIPFHYFRFDPLPGCENNLRNPTFAFMNAAASRIDKLEDTVVADREHPPQSWRLNMLDYMEREFDQDGYGISTRGNYAFDQEWDAPANLPVARVHKSQYSCPWNLSPTDSAGRYFADYAAVTGPDTAFPDGKGMHLDDIANADGLSQTMLLGECSGLNIVWTEPRDIDTSKQKIGVNLPSDRPGWSSSILSSYHRGGAYAAFADGRVRFISEKINPKVLHALTTATGGENLPAGSW
jgi:prepilin-type processing-associated H-X9-DG protein